MKDIPGYEGRYKIDEHGNVFSFYKNGKIKQLSSFPQMYDYDIINLRSDGKPTTFLIHQLVMNTYGPPRPWPPKDYVITHLDGDKKNNHISNLKWIKRANVKTKKGIPIKAIGVDDNDVIVFKNITYTCKYFHTNYKILSPHIGNDSVYKGYKFEYVDKKKI